MTAERPAKDRSASSTVCDSNTFVDSRLSVKLKLRAPVLAGQEGEGKTINAVPKSLLTVPKQLTHLPAEEIEVLVSHPEVPLSSEQQE